MIKEILKSLDKEKLKGLLRDKKLEIKLSNNDEVCRSYCSLISTLKHIANDIDIAGLLEYCKRFKEIELLSKERECRIIKCELDNKLNFLVSVNDDELSAILGYFEKLLRKDDDLLSGWD